MALPDVLMKLQTWSDYISNRDRFQFEKALARRAESHSTQLARSNRDDLPLGLALSLSSEFVNIGAAISGALDGLTGVVENFGSDFNILMGDVIWKLEAQSKHLDSIGQMLQAPLDTAAKELRARAVDAYNNGWYEEALNDFLESERKNYQDFLVCRYIGNIYFYQLNDVGKAFAYYVKAAKYAEPRNALQAAEAHHFAGVACAVLQDFKSGLRHMREAVRLHPDFWEAHFFAAEFAAASGTSETVIHHLEKAIRGEPHYFERAQASGLFQDLRPNIDNLLGRLRSECNHTANESLREMERVVRTVARSGSEKLQAYEIALGQLRETHKRGQYAADRALILQVEASSKEGFLEAIKTLQARIGLCRASIQQIERAHKERIDFIQRPVRDLQGQRASIKFGFKEWNYGCGTIFFLWVGCMFVIGIAMMTIGRQSLDLTHYPVLLVSTFVVPFVLPFAVNKLMYLSRVLIPISELDEKIRSEELREHSLKKAADSEAGEKKNDIGVEISRLEFLLTKCRIREHF